ncbi:MAG: DNA adenine methylase [Prevotella sp.]|nr:DNA adenine methylase [Prevotella sp.]
MKNKLFDEEHLKKGGNKSIIEQNLWESTLLIQNRPKLPPLLKWPGGKEKELKYILPNIPSHFNKYIEPFVGGGSVFMAVTANQYYVNDFSDELIALYQCIAEQNVEFFNIVQEIINAWDRAHVFFKENKYLRDLYLEYTKNVLDRGQLKEAINIFCETKEMQIHTIIGSFLEVHQKILVEEMQINLFRKMTRMNVLENKQHLLSEKDLNNNIEAAIKSALYMYFRHLYNDKDLQQKDRILHCALFLFIRNYSYSSMFRYNEHGAFNVPYGGIAYNSKSMAKKLQFYKSATLIQHFKNTTLYNLDFEMFLECVEPQSDDFIFLDPPYDSEFSTYAQNEFTKTDQKRLADYLIYRCKAKWMLVIKNTEYIFRLYNQKGINIRIFTKEYLVSFMNRNDRRVTHLLITNY